MSRLHPVFNVVKWEGFGVRMDSTCFQVFLEELIELLLLRRSQWINLEVRGLLSWDQLDCMVPFLGL